MYTALKYIGTDYVPGEILPDDLDEELVKRLLKAGAIREEGGTVITDMPPAAEPEPEEAPADEAPEDEPAEPEPEEAEEAFEEPEAPEVDAAEALVSAEKKPAKRKGGNAK